MLYLIDGREIWGNVFLQPLQRLQELLNDDRKFIPVVKVDMSPSNANFIENSNTKRNDIIILVHKDAILTIEER